MSPYMNALDGGLSPYQLSSILDDIHQFPSLTAVHQAAHRP